MRFGVLTDVSLRHDGYLPEELERHGKRERNLRLFDKALREYPDNLYLWYKYADALRSLPDRVREKQRAAERAAEIAAGLGPAQRRAAPYLGEVFALLVASRLEEGRLEEAGEVLEREPPQAHGSPNYDYVAAVALHVTMGARFGKGRLMVRLTALESGGQLISWAVPFEHLRPGWNFLEIPTVVAGPRQTVELEARWEGDLRAAPQLSLSGQFIGTESCPEVDGGQRLRNPLAMQIWTGLPGARRVSSAFADPAAGSSPFISCHLARSFSTIGLSRSRPLADASSTIASTLAATALTRSATTASAAPASPLPARWES